MSERIFDHLISDQSDALGSVDAAYDLQSLAFAGVNHVEGGAGMNVDDISHLELLLHQSILVDPSNLHLS